MPVDPRVTPAADAIAPKAPGLKDNPGINQLTVDQFGMEVAGELGVDPTNLGSFGLNAQKIGQLERATHSGTQTGNR